MRRPFTLLSLCGLVLCLLTACGPSREEVKKQKEQAKFHYNLAYGYYFDRNGANGDAALQEIMRSIEISAEDADARLLAGLIFMGRERYLDAIEQFKKAIALRKDFYQAQNNLGATYLALGRWDEAIAVFEPLAGSMKNSTPGHAHNNLGWAWFKKGNLKKAKRYFKLANQLAPQLCPAYNNLGMLYIEEDNLSRAEKTLKRGLKRCGTYAEIYYHLGRIHVRRRELGQARSSFARCRELSGDSPLAERCERRLAVLGPAPAQPPGSGSIPLPR